MKTQLLGEHDAIVALTISNLNVLLEELKRFDEVERYYTVFYINWDSFWLMWTR